MELERIIHSQGFGTRKECRKLIRTGRVLIKNSICTDPFKKFNPDEDNGLLFSVDGEQWRYQEKIYILLNKPKGYECSHLPNYHPSIFKIFPNCLINRGLQSVGRLDQDTTGLLLLSDDGQFIHKWSSGKKKIPKSYLITSTDPISDETIKKLETGVLLKDEIIPIKAFNCFKKDTHLMEITILEGKYHQVKRMFAAAGNNIEALHRKSIGGLFITEDVPEGEWDWLKEDDFSQLGNYASNF